MRNNFFTTIGGRDVYRIRGEVVMDAIERALERKKPLDEPSELLNQTWSEFEETISGKKLFLFGVGVCTDFFWIRYGNNIEIEGIIDNDIRKQGKLAEDYQAEYFQPERLKNGVALRISPVELLNEYDSDEVVVLIGSSNYYIEIYQQLKRMGYEKIYILLLMEANEREHNSNALCVDQQVREKEFAKEYAKFPIITKKVVVNESYGGHQKPIIEQLLKLRNDLDVVWIMGKMAILPPEGVRTVPISNWKKCIYELETAKVWIWDLCVPDYIIKREEQKFIQTKHWASITLKKFAFEDPVLAQNKRLHARYTYNSELMDYILVGSAFDEESCRKGFCFNKEFIYVGSPRSDTLFHKEINKAVVYKYYGIEESCHTLLYAPTFRYDLSGREEPTQELKGVNVDFERLRDALKIRFGGNWKILLRLHPSIAQCSNTINRPDFVIDATTYEDSERLVSATDILMTDYSSIMFEASFVEKPVLLYASDRKEYIGKERELLIDYDSLPFPIAETNEELERIIKSFDEKSYHSNVSTFLEAYGVNEDGHASERAAHFISKLIDEGK